MRRSWGRAAAALLVGAAVGLAATGLLASPSPSGAQPPPPPTYHDYVALGDSYTADVLTGPLPPTTQFVPLGCAQSKDDYPHKVARLLGVAAFHDASCGSATTDNMTQPQSVPLNGTAPPQFDALNAGVDLVTVGVGGNDVGFVNDAESCLNLVPVPVPGAPAGLGGSCAARFTAGGVDQIDQAIKATAPKIATLLAGIRQRAPNARILLVNYLDAVPLDGKGCWSIDVPVQNEDMAYLASKFVEMNEMLGWMATLEGVQVVDTFTPTIGHDVCRAPTVRDVEGVIPLSLNPLDINFPLHPNGAGADAQAAAVYAAAGAIAGGG
ncbi:MAG TPA: SGNH/GDSL hydrolase family protein [Acidimicrobiales bacterium]|nr:SGNH/GDSL hydrolase family protein [Acidimicrobiales bacterium]